MEAKGSLIQKLDDFIRAYYLNQVVNGLLLSSAVLIIGGITFGIIGIRRAIRNCWKNRDFLGFGGGRKCYSQRLGSAGPSSSGVE